MFITFYIVYSAYQIVVEEVNPRSRRQATSDCYEVNINLYYKQYVYSNMPLQLI